MCLGKIKKSPWKQPPSLLVNAQDTSAQSDHLARKSQEGDSLRSRRPVIQLPLGCHLIQADWQGFKSKEETKITLGEMW